MSLGLVYSKGGSTRGLANMPGTVGAGWASIETAGNGFLVLLGRAKLHTPAGTGG